MITNTTSEWVADLRAMTCRNCVNRIIVVFKESGNTLIGKIKDIPIELLIKWAAEPHGEKNIENAVFEAEKIFLRAYFEEGLSISS